MIKNKFTNFNWNNPKVVATLPQGKDAEKLYNSIKKNEKKFGKDLGFLDYKNGEIRGSNLLRAGQINYLLKNSGIRVAVPRDDFNESIFNLVRENFYTDFNALVVHKDRPSYKKNNGLWKKVTELIEDINGSVPKHSMVQGYYTLPDKNEMKYGVKIVPAPNFEIIEDNRLSEEYDGWKFDNVDEKGLPLNLDESKGERTFYTRNDGLSGVYLDSGLSAGDSNLSYSDHDGRVVLVFDAKGVAPQNFEVEREINKKISKLKKIKNKYLTEVKNI